MTTGSWPVEIPSGYKFAAIGIETNSVESGLPDTQSIARDLWVCRLPPALLPKHWRGWLGSIRTEQLEAADLWLLTMKQSEHPGIADHDTLALGRRLSVAYYALLLLIENIQHERGMQLSGANADGDPTVSGVQDCAPVYRVRWSPRAHIGPSSFELMEPLCNALVALQLAVAEEQREYGRIWRVTHAFVTGVHSLDWGERVHQFVRCLEGFIFPAKGNSRDDFIERGELFVGDGYATMLGEMYDIRSAVEHLHGPFRFLPKTSPREQRLRLMKQAIAAEALARFCLRRFLLSQSIWKYFDDDVALEHFWLKLTGAQRRHAWGEPLDLEATLVGIGKDSWITDEDLGIRPRRAP